MPHIHRGFTLLEVLIAVSITAMIGVGAVQVITSITQTRDGISKRSQQLSNLQRFNAVVARDIAQFINRPIRDQYGELQDAMLLESGDYLLELTRTGWRNRPATEDPRAELQRVAYRIESMDDEACDSARKRLTVPGQSEPDGDCLVRYVWNVLDRGDQSDPQAMVVLDQLEYLEISVLVDERNTQASSGSPVKSQDWYSSWPALQNSGTRLVLVAMRWKLELPVWGELERVWEIAHDGEVP
ncbi:MAG: type II secretion system minor pseudopilin GspJ [Oceanobacter sp.]